MRGKPIKMKAMMAILKIVKANLKFLEKLYRSRAFTRQIMYGFYVSKICIEIFQSIPKIFKIWIWEAFLNLNILLRKNIKSARSRSSMWILYFFLQVL